MKNNKKGFTLIELLVAMAIIGLLIGMTIFGVSRAFRASRDTKRQNLVREIQTGIVAFEGRNRRLPTGITSTPGSDGKSTILIGTGTNQETLEYDMVVNMVATRSAAGTGGVSPDQAFVCYQDRSTGYALGVLLENGDWYYMTTEECT